MAHEMHELDHAVYGSNKAAWHGLGTVVEGNPSSREALELAKLDWLVTKEPAYASDGDGGRVLLASDDDAAVDFDNMPQVWLTCRSDLPATDLRRVLGAVGKSYTPIQNSEAFEVLDALIGEGGAKIETAGSLFNGRVVYMTALLPDEISIKGDKINKYLLLRTSHDGRCAMEALFTPIRVVCNNTLTWALNKAKTRVKIRHTSGAQSRLDEARMVLGLADQYFGEHAETLKALAAAKIDARFVEAYLSALIPGPKEPEASPASSLVRRDCSELIVALSSSISPEAANASAPQPRIATKTTQVIHFFNIFISFSQ